MRVGELRAGFLLGRRQAENERALTLVPLAARSQNEMRTPARYRSPSVSKNTGFVG